ncbi:hypothetical protein BVG19_g3989 [[Candida] boidinii]|nr:hypothetical protein BVG19_g3989 [[Candida] boidinii]OWB52840.1 hypothetical protein B5S27_g4423 [[Candida] boidinii]
MPDFDITISQIPTFKSALDFPGGNSYIQSLTVLLKDGETTATIYPLHSVDELPEGLLSFLWEEFNMEIDRGDTSPYFDPLTIESFQNYWFSSFAAVMVLGDEPKLDTVRQWEKECLGTFFIQPNYPGRCSHICTGNFLVNAGIRGKGIGKTLTECFLEWAPRLGYTYSVFNLVFETNAPARRILESLNFKRIGRIKSAGILKGHESAVDAIIYGRELISNSETGIGLYRFDKIKYYLETGRYPPMSDRQEKSRLRSSASHYRLDNGKLYLKGKEVISDPTKQLRICTEVHMQHHGGINKTTSTITERYHWSRIKDTVAQAIKNCKECRDTTTSKPGKKTTLIKSDDSLLELELSDSQQNILENEQHQDQHQQLHQAQLHQSQQQQLQSQQQQLQSQQQQEQQRHQPHFQSSPQTHTPHMGIAVPMNASNNGVHPDNNKPMNTLLSSPSHIQPPALPSSARQDHQKQSKQKTPKGLKNQQSYSPQQQSKSRVNQMGNNLPVAEENHQQHQINLISSVNPDTQRHVQHGQQSQQQQLPLVSAQAQQAQHIHNDHQLHQRNFQNTGPPPKRHQQIQVSNDHQNQHNQHPQHLNVNIPEDVVPNMVNPSQEVGMYSSHVDASSILSNEAVFDQGLMEAVELVQQQEREREQQEAEAAAAAAAAAAAFGSTNPNSHQRQQFTNHDAHQQFTNQDQQQFPNYHFDSSNTHNSSAVQQQHHQRNDMTNGNVNDPTDLDIEQALMQADVNAGHSGHHHNNSGHQMQHDNSVDDSDIFG